MLVTVEPVKYCARLLVTDGGGSTQGETGGREAKMVKRRKKKTLLFFTPYSWLEIEATGLAEQHVPHVFCSFPLARRERAVSGTIIIMRQNYRIRPNVFPKDPDSIG